METDKDLKYPDSIKSADGYMYKGYFTSKRSMAKKKMIPFDNALTTKRYVASNLNFKDVWSGHSCLMVARFGLTKMERKVCAMSVSSVTLNDFLKKRKKEELKCEGHAA